MRLQLTVTGVVTPEDVADAITKQAQKAGVEYRAAEIARFIAQVDDYVADDAASEICWRYFESRRKKAIKNGSVDWAKKKGTNR